MTVLGPAFAADLCKENSFTKAQAVKGRWAYDSSCGLCHLYNLRGREPGNFRNETPSIGVLNASYLKTLDANGGMTPPLSGDAFFKKWKDQKAFADRVSHAIDGLEAGDSKRAEFDAQIAAYILYAYCKKL
jgi:hypothetical protein